MKHTIGIVLLAAVATASAGCNGGSGVINPNDYIGKEAPLTLLLVEYHGPEARSAAEKACSNLQREGFGDAFFLADEDEGYVCHGKYEDFADTNYRRDVKRLVGLRDRQGNSIFGRPWLMLLPEPAPPTSYLLTDVPTKYRYTVQIGLFELYGRKKAASRFTEDLRRKGYEAYVYHGDTQSQVTIGSFGGIIFDNEARILDPKDPPKIISPDVKKILVDFPLLNVDGYTMTPEEATKLGEHVTRKIRDPETGKYVETKFDVARTLRSQVVLIPRRSVRPAQPSQPRSTQPLPAGPTLRPPSSR
jgi:hypothetical protein